MRRGRNRLLAWCVVATVLAIPAALVSILRTHRHDEFHFLPQRGAVAWGVLPTNSHSSSKSSMYEFRIYTWQGDFFAVKKAAEVELPSKGFTTIVLSGDNENYSSWSRSDGTFVWIETGRSTTAHEAFTGKSVQDPTWVTVVVSNDAPENWVSHVRLAFQDQE